MRKQNLFFIWILLICCCWLSPAIQAQEEEAADKPKWNEFRLNEDVTLGVNGYLYLYHIRNANCYHTERNAAFTEISAGLGFDLNIRDEISGQIRWVGTGLYGRPDNYLLTPSAEMDTFVDLANMTWHNRWESNSLHITAGLQELIYGDGFLIMDGYSETRAIWTTPIRSFPALKASLEVGDDLVVDAFTAHIRDTFLSQEALLGSGTTFATGGSLHGFNLHSTCCPETVLDFGVFVKEEDGNTMTKSDTVALSIRGEKKINQFTLTGELVREYGQTNVVEGAVTNNNINRRAWGGHLTGRLDLSDSGLKPYVKARYTYFGGDADSSTKTSEAFDPMFFGWNDWGQWWIGDMTSFSVPHSNARILTGETGLTLTDMSTLRIFYFNTQLLRTQNFSNSKHWSHEVNVVYDYDLGGGAFTGLMAGAARPARAAEQFNAVNHGRVNYELIAWMGFAF
ncbi:MAG: hypothetical protein ABIK28_25090 [Planctomycetota bacterium]